MIADSFGEVGVVHYRALLTNTISLSVANRLGFEGYEQIILAWLTAGIARQAPQSSGSLPRSH